VRVKIKKETSMVRQNAIIISKGASEVNALQNLVRAKYIVDAAVGAALEGILKLGRVICSGNGHEVLQAAVM
jgi:hypothetical protein